MIFDGQIVGMMKIEGLARLLLERIRKEGTSLPPAPSFNTAGMHHSGISMVQEGTGLGLGARLSPPMLQFPCLPVKFSLIETPG